MTSAASKSARSIGVFDSGLGGLTVVKELHKRLPHENIIYVGDTARVPYGTKSASTIRRYAQQISFFLLKKKVKLIVVACNSVSATALSVLRSLPVPVIGVIQPGARSSVKKSKKFRIGVIGTRATIKSGAYKKAIRQYKPKSFVWEKACPLFVPLIEEGWLHHDITRRVAYGYLKGLKTQKLDALVLGCTHYPLIKPLVRSIVGKNVSIIDSAEETAKEVEAVLHKEFLSARKKKKGRMEIFVTDQPSVFTSVAEKFLGQPLRQVTKLNLDWL